MTFPLHDRRVQYVANLGSEHENVTVYQGFGGIAIYRRFGREVARFVPSAAQRKKIRTGRGKINITTAQIYKASLRESRYGNRRHHKRNSRGRFTRAR